MAAKKPDPQTTVSIPLAGENFTRPGGVNNTKWQQFLNCAFYKTTNPLTKQEYIRVGKRPGVGAFSTITGARKMMAAKSIHNKTSDPKTYVLFEENTTKDLLIVDIRSSTILDTIAATDVVRASQLTGFPIGTDTAVVFWFSDNGTKRGFIYNQDTDTSTEITAADFPDDKITGNFVYKNGYLYIMTNSNGRIYNSDLDAPTVWGATSYISTAAQRGGVTLAEYKTHIAAFGQEYIEFYSDVGNALGSPLRRDDELTIKGFGIAENNQSAFKVFQALDTLWWINNDVGGASGWGVYYLDNYKPTKLSSPEVDYFLTALMGGGSGSDFYIYGIFKSGGYNHLVFGQGSTEAFAINIDLKTTSRWTFGTSFGLDNDGIVTNLIQIIPDPIGRLGIYSDRGQALLSDTTYQDQGAAFTWSVTTRPLDFGTSKLKRMDKLALQNLIPATGGPTVNVSWSDNDYSTYSTARTLGNGIDSLRNGGTFKNRSFKLTEATNTELFIDALEITITQLLT